jgi:hypothetical protein
MNRKVVAIQDLITLGEAAGFKLPKEILEANHVYLQTKSLVVEEPTPQRYDTIAARIIAAVVAGKQPDALTLAREYAKSHLEYDDYKAASLILAEAVDQASNNAVQVAAAATEQIIVNHLRPALKKIDDDLRQVAAVIKGHEFTATALLTAPQKVREAYAALPALVAKRQAIFAARWKANLLGDRLIEHDFNAIFANFAKPLAFDPNRTSTQRVQIPAPTEATEYALWAVSDAAAVGSPWLPTTREQDKAWIDEFGNKRFNAPDRLGESFDG